jgi:TPR repeat protein
MLSLRTKLLAEFVFLSLCSVAPLTAAAQVAGAPPPAAVATLDFLPDRNDPVALKCDALADYPSDPHRVGDGVVFGQISVADALPVCERAAAQLPARPRYQYLYGRVLEAAQRFDESARQLSLADQAGYGLARYNLGNLYADGTGVPQDLDKAATLYFGAGNLGIADAFAELGTLYTGETSPNYPEALSWFERAVQGGSISGRVYLGELYLDGHGVKEDFSKAVGLFLEAEAGGDSDGIFDLGLVYRDGAGVPKNPVTAYGWFARAAQKGHPFAMVEVANAYYLGRGVGEDHREAFGWFLRAAYAGVRVAQRNVATLFDLGDGVTRSDADAAAWYRKAAEQGDAIAMTQLSHHLRRGQGVAQDVAQSWQWLTNAAEAGFPDAQTELGMFYEDGFGHQQAAYWFGEAAKQGDALAQVRLGSLYEQGFGVDRDLDQARRLFTQAAASTDPEVAQMARASLAALNPPPAPAPQPSRTAAAPPEAAPPAPQRRLPTQPSVSASDRADATAKVVIGVGLAIGAILLLNHFTGSDSQASTGSAPAPFVSSPVVPYSPTPSRSTSSNQPFSSHYTDPARMNQIPMGNLGDSSIATTGNRWAR